MADSGEIKAKNLVYLMLRRYQGDWKEKFPSDMGIPLEKCEKIYERYADEVLSEIEKEDNDEDSIPSADELINKGMKKLRIIINSCEDASKLTRSIEILSELRDSGVVKTDKKATIFDKMQEKYRRKQNDKANSRS